MTDDRMTLTFIQGQLLRRLQLTPTRVIGRTLPDLLMDGREDHPLIQGHLAALGGHENSVRIEWGGRIYYARIAPLRDTDGRIIGCVGIHQEIGWLPDDEGTLRESDIRLQRIVDTSMMGIAFGNDHGQITDANEAFLQLAGYSREDLERDAISWPALAPVEFHSRQLTAIQEVRATGRCAPFETDLIRTDGRRVTVLVSGARLSARRREGVAFVIDISDRRRLEERFRAELACADALLEHPPPAALDATLRVICDQWRWQAALIWRPDPSGDTARFDPRCGAATATDEALAAMAREAATAAETLWSTTSRTLLVPLTAIRPVAGVLVLVSHPDRVPETWQLDAARAVANRIGKFIARQKA